MLSQVKYHKSVKLDLPFPARVNRKHVVKWPLVFLSIKQLSEGYIKRHAVTTKQIRNARMRWLKNSFQHLDFDGSL